MSNIDPDVRTIYRLEANNILEQFNRTMDSKSDELFVTLVEKALIKAYYEGRESILSLGE